MAGKQFRIAPEHPLRGFRAAGRGGARRDRGGRRPDPLRRDGQPLRAQPHGRAAGVRGDPAASSTVPIDVHLMVKPVDRIVPGFREGGRAHHQLPSGGDRARRPHARAHPRAGLQGGPRVQSRDAARLSRPRDGQGRPGAHHVGEPGLRRPVVHRLGARRRSREARKRIDASGRDIWLEVDGGIKADNIAEVARAGADTFVAGSAIFGEKDRAGAIAPPARRAEAVLQSAPESLLLVLHGTARISFGWRWQSWR